MRKDLAKVLKRMIADGPGEVHLWAQKKFSEDNERLYDALWNGDRWNDLQARAHLHTYTHMLDQSFGRWSSDDKCLKWHSAVAGISPGQEGAAQDLGLLDANPLE